MPLPCHSTEDQLLSLRLGSLALALTDMIAPQDSPLLRKDDDPAQNYASSAPLYSSGPAPPPYTNYQATSQYIVAPATPEPGGEPIWKRFIKGFPVFILIWFLVGISIPEGHISFSPVSPIC